jgi:sugar (pentulose or hexulose) kinase
MRADLIVAADFGTSGVKVGVIDRELRLLAWTAASYPLTADAETGAAEQNPSDWWDATTLGIARLADEVPNLRERASALVFCAQMCGVVCVDRHGEPLRPCLIWLDKRSGPDARRLVGGMVSYEGYGLRKLATWLPLANGAPSLTGADPPTKMRWLCEHEPETWRATYKVLDVKDWLLMRATGRAVTTPDCANLTWMMDSRTGHLGWSPTLMRLVGVDRNRLPAIVDGTAMVGSLQAEASRQLGLPENLTVVAGSGDVCAAALGTGAVTDGALHLHVGSSSWIGGFFPSRRLNVSSHYATIASAVNGRPLLIATQETSGECLRWAARAFGHDVQEKEETAVAALLSVAQDCEPNRHNPIFLPWLAGERVPVDDPRLRGGFLGLSLAHDRRHLARAVLEGMALNMRWACDDVRRERGAQGGPMPVVGAVAGERFFVQLLADVLQCRLLMLKNPSCAGLLGVSTLAATALGWTKSVWEACEACAHKSELIVPDAARADFYNRRMDQFKDAWRRTKPWFRKAMS